MIPHLLTTKSIRSISLIVNYWERSILGQIFLQVSYIQHIEFPLKKIWHNKALLKALFFAWTTLLGKIFTTNNLQKRGVSYQTGAACASKVVKPSTISLLSDCHKTLDGGLQQTTVSLSYAYLSGRFSGQVTKSRKYSSNSCRLEDDPYLYVLVTYVSVSFWQQVFLVQEKWGIY